MKYLLIFSILLSASLSLKAQSQEDLMKVLENSKNGAKLMDHWLYTPEGDSVLFSSFEGKHIVIDLWATWCRPCIAEAPHFEKRSEEHSEEDYKFISISIDKDRKRWEQYCKQVPANIERYWVGSKFDAPPFWFSLKKIERGGQTMMVSSIPQFVVIDEEQTVFEKAAPRPSNAEAFNDLLKGLE